MGHGRLQRCARGTPHEQGGDRFRRSGFPNRAGSPEGRWSATPWREHERARVNRMVMKPPSFSGKGSVFTFLAKFDNCDTYNGWSNRERLHLLTNSLEDLAAQVLWDLQSRGEWSSACLRKTLKQVHGCEGQAEVYRSQLKMIRRKKGSHLQTRLW